MSDATYDFDAGWAEHDSETFSFRFLGEDWELPHDVPAETILRVERLMVRMQQTAEDEDLPGDVELDESVTPEGILRRLVGDETVDAWLARGCGYRRLLDVLSRLMAFYQGGDPMQAGKGNRRQRRASAAKKRKGGQKSTR